jgi:26S proteasome regulatory subunit N2
MPKIEFVSNAPPSVFGYPPPMEEKKGDKKEKVEKAILSITAKQKKRDAEKKQEKGEEKMEIVRRITAFTHEFFSF